jgi:hypothetical protein
MHSDHYEPVAHEVEDAANPGTKHLPPGNKAVLPPPTPTGEPASPGARILLPYAIANVVFIQQLGVCWMVLVGLLDSEARSLLYGGGFGLAVGCLLWPKALRGHRWAVIAVYVLYLPSVLSAILLPLRVLMTGVAFAPLGTGVVLPMLAISLFLAVLFLLNLWEEGLWAFVRLDARCPCCRSWRFGKIKRPCTLTCGGCGAKLEFVRAGD